MDKTVTSFDLFTGFLKIGLIGFGGAGPGARRVVVEERAWLSDGDYAAILGFGQVLPGSNTLNAAVLIGQRFQGATGSLIAVCALLAAPLGILVIIASLYDRFAALPDVRAALSGVAAGAAGLAIGTGFKMGRSLKMEALPLGLCGAALIGVAVLRCPLYATVLVLAPLGVLATALKAPR